MAKVTIADYDGAKHPNPMRWVDNGQLERHTKSGGLAPYKVCTVEVCGFEFIFHSVMQAELCRDYYSRQVQPTSRLPVNTESYGDHWEAQRWFEELPMYLLEKSKRPKVIAALTRAIAEYREYPGATTHTVKPSIWDVGDA